MQQYLPGTNKFGINYVNKGLMEINMDKNDAQGIILVSVKLVISMMLLTNYFKQFSFLVLTNVSLCDTHHIMSSIVIFKTKSRFALH